MSKSRTFLRGRVRLGGFLLACLLAGGANRANAQVATAAVNGIVRDASGAAVANAEVALLQVETGVTRKSMSNASGVYAFLNLTPGKYSLTAISMGFAASKSEPFTLVVNQTDLRLLAPGGRHRAVRIRQRDRDGGAGVDVGDRGGDPVPPDHGPAAERAQLHTASCVNAGNFPDQRFAECRRLGDLGGRGDHAGGQWPEQPQQHVPDRRDQ